MATTLATYKPRWKTRSASRRFRVAINRGHRRAMQKDVVLRAELRAWVIKGNLSKLESSGFVLSSEPQPFNNLTTTQKEPL